MSELQLVYPLNTLFPLLYATVASSLLMLKPSTVSFLQSLMMH